jgi:hypothetical protein
MNPPTSPEITFRPDGIHVRGRSPEAILDAVRERLEDPGLTFDQKAMLLRVKWHNEEIIARRAENAEENAEERTAAISQAVEKAISDLPEFPFATPESDLERTVREALEGPE